MSLRCPSTTHGSGAPQSRSGAHLEVALHMLAVLHMVAVFPRGPLVLHMGVVPHCEKRSNRRVIDRSLVEFCMGTLSFGLRSRVSEGLTDLEEVCLATSPCVPVVNEAVGVASGRYLFTF